MRACLTHRPPFKWQVRNAQADKAASDKQASASKALRVLKALPVRQVKVGDAVSLKTFPDQVGEVISVGSDANDYFRVKLGLLTVKAKLSDIIAVNAKSKSRTAKQQPPMPANTRQKSNKARKNKSHGNKKSPSPPPPPTRGGEDSGGDRLDLSKLNRRL